MNNNNLKNQILGSTVFKLALIGGICVFLSIIIDLLILPGMGFGIIPFTLAAFAIIYAFTASSLQMIFRKKTTNFVRFCQKNIFLVNVISSIIVSILLLLPFFLSFK